MQLIRASWHQAFLFSPRPRLAHCNRERCPGSESRFGRSSPAALCDILSSRASWLLLRFFLQNFPASFLRIAAPAFLVLFIALVNTGQGRARPRVERKIGSCTSPMSVTIDSR